VPAAATAHLAAANARVAYANLPIAQMHAPLAGPVHPAAAKAGAGGHGGLGAGRNHGSGHVVDTAMSSFHFDDQIATFDARGYAAAPGGQGMVGDLAAAAAAGGGTVSVPGAAGPSVRAGTGAAGSDPATASAAAAGKRRREAAEAKAAKRAAAAAEAQAVLAAGGAWTLVRRAPWADRAVAPAKPTAEQMEFLRAEGFIKEDEDGGGEGGEAGALVAAGAGAGPLSATSAAATAGTSKFHGGAEVDELGRSWMAAPRGGRKGPPDSCALPRRCVATWAAHGKGTSVVRFFPGTGHLLLSAGLDGKAKVWDARGLGGGGSGGGGAPRLLRSYAGSTKGIRDAAFNNDGSRFAYASYDKVVKLWDTETGKVLAGLGAGSRAMFYCSVFHPDPDKQDVVLAGCGDKKIYQWDVRTGEAVQVYDYHLAAVNTVTFFDGGRKFASTSDDKTVRVWEYGIPVQVKLVADPGMHAIPATAAHPGGGFMVGQSMDNSLVTFATGERFKAVGKKTFKGHAVAGYACRPTFSPDGRFLVSGDGEGKAFYWDWKTTRVARTVQAHDGVCIDAAWHPTEASRMVTAGWDGNIKCWE
jgi:pre-mRNA-processing factor 17